MRMRTYGILLVQIVCGAVAASAAAQPTDRDPDHDYGAAEHATRADVLSMPDRERTRATEIATPPRGLRKREVLERYGAPATRHPAVGQPPITRWDYPDYHLYFEYNHVLHAVQPRAPVPVAHRDELNNGLR